MRLISLRAIVSATAKQALGAYHDGRFLGVVCEIRRRELL